MATGNKGSRLKLPGAATASIPTMASAVPAVMTAAEAAPALEAAHAAADIVLPVPIASEAIAGSFSASLSPNPDSDPAPAAAPATPTADATEDSIMDTTTIENTASTVADKSQAMLADVNDRTKGAIEKGTKMFAELTEFNKGNVEAMVESSKIAVRGIETMGQDAAAYAKTSFEGATAAMRTLATVKSPTEFMKLQADFARQALEAMVAQTSRSTEASLKLAGEIAQPISNRVAIAADKMKIAA